MTKSILRIRIYYRIKTICKNTIAVILTSDYKNGEKSMQQHTLDKLYAIIEQRKNDDASDSYTKKLLNRGVEKIAQKVGEEAVETVIEGIRHDKDRLISESADLLYHLLVLWSHENVDCQDVWQELEQRMSEDKYKN